MKNISWRPVIVFFLIFAFLLTLDLVSKHLTVGANYLIIPNFLRFVSVRNYGISFGLFQNASVFITVATSIVAVISIIFWWFWGRHKLVRNIAFAFFISGALGNIIDRISLGYVRDFVHFTFTNSIFNIADVCLTIGTAMLVVILIIGIFKGAKNANKS